MEQNRYIFFPPWGCCKTCRAVLRIKSHPLSLQDSWWDLRFSVLPGHPKAQAVTALPQSMGLWTSVHGVKLFETGLLCKKAHARQRDELRYWHRLVRLFGSASLLMAQDNTLCGSQVPSSPSSFPEKLHWSHWWRQREGSDCTNKMDKHIFLNCILFYSYFFLHLSLMLCLVQFWCSLLSSHISFPNTSNQFYNSAEGYLADLLARIEQQLIIGSLFSKLLSSVAGQRILHRLHTDFRKGPGRICAGEHLGKQSSSQERNHALASASPGQSRNLVNFSAVHVHDNFVLTP